MAVRIDFVVTLLTRIASTALAALGAVLVARYFGDVGLGVFALLRALPTVLMVLTECGFSHAYPYLINNRGYRTRDVAASGMLAALVVSSVQVLIWLVLMGPIESGFSLGLGQNAFLVASLLAPLAVFRAHFTNILRAEGKLRLANAVGISGEFLVTALIGLAIWLGDSSHDELSYSLVIAQGTLVLGTMVYLGSRSTIGIPRFNRVLLKESFAFGIRSQIGNAFQVLNYRLDHLIIGVLVGPAMLGIYVVATKAAEFFRFLAVSVVFVAEPRIARCSPGEAVNLVRKYYAPIFFLNLVLVLVGAFVGPRLIPWVFTDWSSEAILPFWILLAGLAVAGSNGLIGAYNLGQGKPQLNTLAIGVALIVTVVANILLTPAYEIVGAAIASALALLTSAVLFGALFLRDYRRYSEGMGGGEGNGD
ncbi:MAG: O-antigen/teichoic acid export membrane protein [Rhodothermales bacterium]